MKQFDDKFADKVRETFDDFSTEIPHDAWKDLQQRRGKKGGNKTFFQVVPLKLWAASVAVIISLGLVYWMFDNQQHREQSAVSSHNSNSARNEKSFFTEGQNIKDDTDTLPGENDDTDKIEVKGMNSRNTDNDSQYFTDTQIVFAEDEVLQKDNATWEVNNEDNLLLADIQHDAESNEFQEEENFARSNSLQEKSMADYRIKGTAVLQEITLNSEQMQDQGYTNEGKIFLRPVQKETENSRYNSWQAAAGPMVPFTRDHPASGFGFSAGLTNQMKINKRITFSAGALLAYNELSFDPATGRNAEESFFDTGEASEFFTENNIAADQYSTNYQNQYEILAVDIPLNVKLDIFQGPGSGMYFSTGVSSLLYLQQNITEQRIYEAVSYANTETFADPTRLMFDESQAFNEGVFSGFDFARLVNLSVGYELNRNNQTFIIEPFLKYPLGKVTSRPVSLGMGGVNLRYKFGN